MIKGKPLLSLMSMPFMAILVYEEGLGSSIFGLSLILLIIDKIIPVSRFYLYSIFIFLFYSKIIFDDTYGIIHNTRFMYFGIIFLFFSVILNYLVITRKNLIFPLNIFWVILTLNFIIFNLFKSPSDSDFTRDNFLSDLMFKFKPIDFSVQKSNKPVVLIVLDELSSTSEIYNFTKDSIDLKLDSYLENNDFQVIKDFKSLTKWTKLSLPSLFNFNLHGGLKYDSKDEMDEELYKIEGFKEIFYRNLLVDSLNHKGVQVNSYGLIPFDNGLNDPNFPYYWHNIPVEESSLKKIINRTIIGFYLNNTVGKKDTLIDDFRKNTFQTLTSAQFENNNFYYFHLFFPHDPFRFFDEYLSPELNYNFISDERYLLEHISFRRWFVEKFISTLENNNLDNVRLIITGDHGFRYNTSINPRLTNLYTKGYSNSTIENVECVQDLGYLIYQSF